MHAGLSRLCQVIPIPAVRVLTWLLLAASAAWAGLPPGARVLRDGRWERQRQIRESVDQGDRLATPSGSAPLRRLKGAVALRLTGEIPIEQVVEELSSPGGGLPGYRLSGKGGCGVVVLEAARDLHGHLLPGVVDEAEPWLSARAAAGVAWSGPVFVEARNGLWKIPTGDLLLRLQPGTDPETYFGVDWTSVSRWPGTAFHFRLPRPAATAEELLEEAARRMADPRVRWAEPDFVFQVVRTLTPNDSLFSSQWYLRGTNLLGADVSAAWDRSTGSTNVVIAILDDGVQLSHPDLSGNIFVNSGETANGLDDDGNGYVDDLRGWDFLDSDSDVNPADPLDNHGTSTSGIAAARGNNATGIAGTAFGCRILPVKILRGDFGTSVSRTASAIRYAGGINDAGGMVWRGADVVSVSLGFTGSAAVDDAFADVARFGRAGKGCPIFVSSGNDASGWLLSGILGFPAGTYRFRWVYSKDAADSWGDDTLWLDSVEFPGGGLERFESLSLPSGWTTAGNLPWVSVQDGVQGNHAVTGWNGPGSRAIRAGRITHSQYSAVEIRRAVGSGDLTYWIWVSSEQGYDYFDLYVDGVPSDSYSGVPFIQTALDYPGMHPDTMAVGASTDFGYRADYSQYGTASNGDRLDFLAPSSGGRADVYSTDRTGSNGYNSSSDYVSDFGGTSASAPLAAGVGALLLARNPELTAAEVRAILQGTADHIGGVTYVAGWNPEYGYGRINANRAVIQARPDLVVRQSASAPSLSVGQTVTFTVTVTNQHPAIARSVEITELPMPGLSFRSATVSLGSWTNTGASVICRLGDLPAGTQATLSLVFDAAGPGTGTNTAAAVSSQPDANPADDQVSTALTIVGGADLAVEQTLSPVVVTVDEPISIVSTVRNSGSIAATNVTLTDRFPAWAVFRSATVSQGTYTVAAGVVQADMGDVAAGAAATLTLEVSAPMTGLFTNELVAAAVPADDNPANDLSVLNRTVVERPALAASVSGGTLNLTWPTNGGIFLLESTPDLTPPSVWTTVPGSPLASGDRFTLTVVPTNGTRFYRLSR